MPPSASQLSLIRLQIGDTGASPAFSDAEINALWDIAADTYSATGQLNAQTRVYLLDALLADAAKRVTYEQNQSKEQLSDVFKNLLKLRDAASADLEKATAASVGAVKLGTIRKARPTRDKDVPNA